MNAEQRKKLADVLDAPAKRIAELERENAELRRQIETDHRTIMELLETESRTTILVDGHRWREVTPPGDRGTTYTEIQASA